MEEVLNGFVPGEIKIGEEEGILSHREEGDNESEHQWTWVRIGHTPSLMNERSDSEWRCHKKIKKSV